MEHECKAAAGDLTTLLSRPSLNTATQQNPGTQPAPALPLLQHLLNWERALVGRTPGYFQVRAALAAAGLSSYVPADGSRTLQLEIATPTQIRI